ncbi:cytochrome-c peroxidase [Caminibacter sp.]
MRKIILILIFEFIFAMSPVAPIKPVKYNHKKAILGKMLFFDKRLSADGKVSCASCHSPKHGGADNKKFSIGVFGRIDAPMNSPTVYNAVFNCWQFWNGRAKNLEQQAAMALMDEKEMGMSIEGLEKVVNSIPEYRILFENVYGKKHITFEMVCNAIAEFEKALVTPNSRFDKYLEGDKNAITPDEKKGYMLFKAYGCITCHNGKNFGGNSFQKLGIFIDNINIPEGRDRYQVTQNPLDRYVYKVPTLRNIALTAPYLHDGSIKDLFTTIKYMSKLNLGVEMPDRDVRLIVKFLDTLTGETPKILKDE